MRMYQGMRRGQIVPPGPPPPPAGGRRGGMRIYQRSHNRYFYKSFNKHYNHHGYGCHGMGYSQANYRYYRGHFEDEWMDYQGKFSLIITGKISLYIIVAK